jgi:hypothetical protein
MSVSLPLSKPLSPIAESSTEKGDCGSWVLNPINGEWLGHIIAGRPGTSVAYIVLARDVAKDITNHLGAKTVQMACDAELEVIGVVADIKKTIPIIEPSASRHDIGRSMFTPPSEKIASTKSPSMTGGTMQEPSK